MSLFNVVADEYYNPERHPTCANFREGSERMLRDWLSKLPHAGKVCEVGAGRSVAAEILAGRVRDLDGLWLTDESARMLEYSRAWESRGAKLLQAPAHKLPIAAGCVDCVVSSLGDPYNVPRFWSEARRVLKPGGMILYTTPSYEWAECFRSGASEIEFAEAEFQLRDGRRIRLPSYIYREADQRAMVEKNQLELIETHHVTIGEITNTPLSAKLCPDRGKNAPVVTGYVVRKTTSGSLSRRLAR